MKWSAIAWKQVEGIYRKILQHPFVRELAEGTLSRERFDFYISQDALYIDNYGRVLAHIASRIPSKEHSEFFLHSALEGVLIEKALHQSFIGYGEKPAPPTPTCLLYMNYESSKASGPVEVETAAILPCFWVYQRVGEEILKMSRPGNPYKQWIKTYADEVFKISTQKVIEICDELAEQSTPSIMNAMTDAFIYSTKMEWMFWDSAYNLEQWKI